MKPQYSVKLWFLMIHYYKKSIREVWKSCNNRGKHWVRHFFPMPFPGKWHQQARENCVEEYPPGLSRQIHSLDFRTHTERRECYCYCLLHHPKRGGWRLPPCEIPSFKDDILLIPRRFALWECRAAAMASHAQCTVNKSGTNPILTMIADYLLSFILNRNSKHYGMAT